MDEAARHKLLERCDYYGSRGPSGMAHLVGACRPFRRKKLPRYPDWLKRIPLHGAMMNGHVKSTGRWLVEILGVELDTRDKAGNTALHHAIIWGRLPSIHFLLSKGAEITAINGEGHNIVQQALQRQSRLEGHDNMAVSAEDQERLVQEGLEIVNMLRAVLTMGSYARWARLRTGNTHVALMMPHLILAENRQRLAVLRSLVCSKRAALLSRAALQAREAAEKAKLEAARIAAEALERKNRPPPLPLPEAMANAGLEVGWARDLRMLGATTVDDLANVSNADIGALGDLDRLEKRRLWLWIKDQQATLDPPPKSKAKATPAKAKKGAKAKLAKTKKTKKKKKKKKGGNNTASSSAGSGTRAKKLEDLDALAVCFDDRMPNDAFGTILSFLWGGLCRAPPEKI